MSKAETQNIDPNNSGSPVYSDVYSDVGSDFSPLSGPDIDLSSYFEEFQDKKLPVINLCKTKKESSFLDDFVVWLNDNRSVYFLFGSLDGINLILSIIKLVHVWKLSLVIDFFSADDWILPVVAILFGLFAALGSWCEKNSANPIASFIAESWTYIRDVLKALKWTYKGVNNIIRTLIMLDLAKESLANYLFPCGIAIALFAAVNRLYIRSIRDARNKIQENNADIIKEMYYFGHVLRYYETPPIPNNDGKYSVAYRKSYYVVDKQGAQKALFYIDEHGDSHEQQGYTSDKEWFNNLPGEKASASSPLKSEDNEEKDLEKMEFKRSNILSSFQKINKNTHKTTSKDKIFAELIENFKKSVIIAKDDWPQGSCENLGMSADAWNEYRNGLLYKDGKVPEDPEDKSAELLNPDSAIRYDSYFAVFFSSLADGLYFYMGTLLLIPVSPALFWPIVIANIIIFAVSIITRFYEEYFYQNKFKDSIINMRLTLLVKEICFLNLDENSEKYNGLKQQFFEHYESSTNSFVDEETQKNKDHFYHLFVNCSNGLALQSIAAGLIACLAYLNLPFVAAIFPVVGLVLFGAGFFGLIGLILWECLFSYEPNAGDLPKKEPWYLTEIVRRFVQGIMKGAKFLPDITGNSIGTHDYFDDGQASMFIIIAAVASAVIFSLRELAKALKGTPESSMDDEYFSVVENNSGGNTPYAHVSFMSLKNSKNSQTQCKQYNTEQKTTPVL
jgi:hypothetical protein